MAFGGCSSVLGDENVLSAGKKKGGRSKEGKRVQGKKIFEA